MPETIDLDLTDGVLTITLNRPEALNAFTVTMAEELIEAFGRASSDDDVRAVIVTGAGRAFCAGMDLSSTGNVFGLDESMEPTLADMTERFEEPEFVSGVRDTGGRVSLAIYACNKPVIGAINGAAVGIGATMTLPMDVRLASDRARIGFVFGRLGIVPEACSSWFLPRIVGISRALEWVYTADILSAQDALDGGLLHSIHGSDDLLPAARELARRFTEHRSAIAIALSRHLLWHNMAAGHPIDAHRLDSLAMFATSMGDGKEGVAAFLEKRDPVFLGRASELPSFVDVWLAESAQGNGHSQE